MPRLLVSHLALLSLLCPHGNLSAAARDRAHDEFFESKVRPLLVKRCLECHGEEAEGGLRLDSPAGVKAGGDSGAALVPGDPQQSLLIRAIRYRDDLQMPPNSKLPAEEIAILTQWVKREAPFPGGDAPPRESPARPFPEILEARKQDHWAFAPIRRSSHPEVRDRAWPNSPIDRFVLARLEASGLRPAEPADRATLLRRLSFDLRGLAPTREESQRFLSDPRPTPRVVADFVERYLASPAFGERWARHWLDVVRYSETSGHVTDPLRDNAWQYRDYVIQALNDDLPFDRFVLEHLAGDQLPPRDNGRGQPFASVAATGYLWFHEMHFKPVDPIAQQANLVDAQIDVTTKAFLGLTVACARCHDHKFDAISQRDYYALAGIFHSTRESSSRLGPPPAKVPEQAAALQSQLEALHRKGRREALRDREQKVDQVPPISETVYSVGIKKTMTKLRDELARVLPGSRDWAPVAADAEVRNARVHIRGDHKNLGEEVPRQFLTALVAQKPSGAPAEDHSGRRYLAEQIVAPGNPLTARVQANRIWQHLFGRGLVSTPNNFGKLGAPPSHPELLDYLASRLLESGWSAKALLREITTSQVYALSSTGSSKSRRIDPENALLQHQNVRRLEAEALRDTLLQLAGSLRGEMFGRSIAPYLSENTTSNKPANIPAPGPLDGNGRKSIYLTVRRNFANPFLATFDFPNPSNSVGQRTETVGPPQSLAMMNSPLVLELARRFAGRMLRTESSPGERVEAVYWAALGRAPQATERAYLVSQVQKDIEGGHTPEEAWTDVAHVLFNLNDFLFIR